MTQEHNGPLIYLIMNKSLFPLLILGRKTKNLKKKKMIDLIKILTSQQSK